MKRSKKRKAARTPVQRELLIQQMTANSQKQSQMNYDYEREQNNRIAKLLNISPGFNESPKVGNYSSDDQKAEFNHSSMTQLQHNNQVSAFSPIKNNRANLSHISNEERDKYLQGIIDQGVKLPIITQDSALQRHINNYSQNNLAKNQEIIPNRLRSGTSLSNVNARNDYFRQLKRLSTQEDVNGKSNFKTNRTQVLDTTMSNSNRRAGGVQSSENENEGLDP